jgi:hypothetical protein
MSYGHKIELRVGSSDWKAERVFFPNGVVSFPSRIVTTEELRDGGISTGNGNVLRKGGTFCRKYKLAVVQRDRIGNRIDSYQVMEYSSCNLGVIRSSIPSLIREKLSEGRICPLTGEIATEVDHKDGRNSTGSGDNDFQYLSKTANVLKREACASCKIKSRRPDARHLGFPVGWSEGSVYYTNDIGCKGCRWYDIREFHRVMSEKYNKP